jgi:hypothetical protein
MKILIVWLIVAVTTLATIAAVQEQQIQWLQHPGRHAKWLGDLTPNESYVPFLLNFPCPPLQQQRAERPSVSINEPGPFESEAQVTLDLDLNTGEVLQRGSIDYSACKEQP